MNWLKETGFQRELFWSEETGDQRFRLPEWASFLIWLGSVNHKLQVDGIRVFCVVLLPTRICCSALAAIGSIASSLTNQKNDLSWDLFLECEKGLTVYTLHKNNKGKIKQLEGVLGDVIPYDEQILREIKIISKSSNCQNLKILVSEKKFLDSKISFHPHHRSKLLNRLHEFSEFFSRSLENFNENRLLLNNPENIVITNRAGWERENDNIFMGTVEKKTFNLLPVKEILLSRFSRTQLYSPKSNDLQDIETPLAILDGLDALRSREYIKARNVIILLDKNEYREEAADILLQFSNYRLKERPHEFDGIPSHCPDGIEVQFYLFE